MDTVDAAIRVASATGGQVLRTATGLIAARPAAKPLHPRGDLVRGTLRRFGREEKTGATWLDDGGQDRVLVRVSRAVGLPSGVPDIHGLALRVPRADGHGGLLFASTGLGRVARSPLTAAGSPRGRAMTTLLPYRTPAGGVLLSAVFHDDAEVRLAWAIRAGAWPPFARLMLDDEPLDQGDTHVSFDPVGNLLPGLENYRWVQLLMEPSYATARHSRSLPLVGTVEHDGVEDQTPPSSRMCGRRWHPISADRTYRLQSRVEEPPMPADKPVDTDTDTH